MTLVNAGKVHNIDSGNMVAYGELVFSSQIMGLSVFRKSCVYEEMKNSLDSGNAYFHSVPNLLSSNLLYKNMKIKTYRNMILSVVLWGVKLSLSH